MERWEAKILSLVVCLVALFLAVALPIKVSQLFYSQGKRGERWLDIVNCFGGGVFLGTYLVTFPQVRVLIEDALLKPANLHYPLPEVLVGAGFFMIMFLEKVISSANKHKTANKESIEDSGSVVNATELKQSDTVVTFVSDLNESFNTEDYANNIPRHVHNNNTNNIANNTSSPVLPNIPGSVNDNHGNTLNNTNDLNNTLANGHSNHAFVHDANDSTTVATTVPTIITTPTITTPVSTSKDNKLSPDGPVTSTPNGASPEHPHEHEPDFTSALKALILMAALAIDNVFIGMGLGLRDTNVGVWNMLITILSHELVISFTLGLALVKHNTTKKVLFLAAVYASMCPIGIGIGTILLDTGVVGEGVELVSGVLQALAAGVFLYVTFFEILDGHVGHNSNVSCLLAILAGFILMALLALLEEDAGEETQMFHPERATALNTTTASLVHDIHSN